MSDLCRLIWCDFRDQYARAREEQADKYFQEIVEIADAATPETVNVARLRVDSRKFTVARLAPKKYGDHISHNVIELHATSEAAGGLPQQRNGNSLQGTRGRRLTAPHA